MPSITFINNNKTIKIDAEYGKSVLNAFVSANLMLHGTECGGRKTCKKCKVKIISGMDNLSPMTGTEKESLSAEELRERIRFACFAVVNGDLTLEQNENAVMKIRTEGMNTTVTGALVVKIVTVTPIASTLKKPIPDDNAIAEALLTKTGIKYTIPFSVRGRLSCLKDSNGSFPPLDVIISDEIIVDIKISNESNKLYGVAVDIGTTTIAAFLYDLVSNKNIAVTSSENSQRQFGADVIARISYSMENDNGLMTLTQNINNKLAEMFRTLYTSNEIDRNDIYLAAFAGNTVMQTLAAGLSPKYIAASPFIAPTLFGYSISLNELKAVTGVDYGINPNASIYFPCAVASYVGGDITAGIIASDTDRYDAERLFIDIGTNGEIGFGGSGGLIFCATAAGPAFEGAHIKKGMPALSGAVSHVGLNSGKIKFETILDASPKGICGSGIVDAVAVMLTVGALDETGCIVDPGELPDEYTSFAENIGEDENGNIFYISKEHDIYITGRDVREIQLAKAAVCGGILTLLHHAGKNLSDIGEVILAGGFGAHINSESACKIGLIPQALSDKIIIAGNTAGSGAAAVLLDMDARKRLDRIAATSRYIELSGDPFFMEAYVEQMMFE